MKTINLQIEPGKARQIYRTADAGLKTILEASAPCGFFSQNVMERVKSYEDACAENGEEPMDEKAMLVAGFRPDEIARRKIETITLALNEGKVMDWNNKESKWFPWFDTSSGFAFSNTSWDGSDACAGIASRLCFKSAELATYAGEQFTDLYKEFMLNN